MGVSEGVAILIEAEHVGARFSEPQAVTAKADRSIKKTLAGVNRRATNDFFEQYGEMVIGDQFQLQSLRFVNRWK